MIEFSRKPYLIIQPLRHSIILKVRLQHVFAVEVVDGFHGVFRGVDNRDELHVLRIDVVLLSQHNVSDPVD